MAFVSSTALDAADSATLPPAFAPYLDRTRRALHARLAEAPAGAVLRRYFERGKMLRAFVVFAANAAVGGEPGEVLMAAEAIELLHGASLFHDDIIDKAAERRGIASLHETLGIGQALVVGDDLLLRAFTALAEARMRHPAERVLEAMEALNQLARVCCRGQFDELCADRWISERDYLAIVSAKTAAPFVAAGVLGVLLGGGNREQAEQIRIYALQIGIAFQINDDLLDLVGEPGVHGKPLGNSLAEGRPMLPLIYLRELSDGVRTQLRSLHERDWPRAEVMELLKEHQIADRVRETQRRHVDAAMGALRGFPNHVGVDALRELASRL
jgi:geranylgeranyl pyrophosphate synthase